MRPLSALLLSLTAGLAFAQDKAPRDSGELLYSTHCIGCHNTQPHWREKKIARDLPGLRAQVVRWQRTAGQNWDAAEIDAVAGYLNRAFYKFPGGSQKG